jgi:hypothetical protein
MAASPFAFEPPTDAAPSGSPFSPLFSSHLPETSSATLSTLDKLSQVLLEHRVNVSVKKELEGLQGELRSEYRPRLKAVKADYMARMVSWNDEERKSENGGKEDVTQTSEEEGAEEGDGSSFAHPTIMSDSDAQAEMSAAVDHQAEVEIAKHLEEAKARIERGVRATKTMEMELWLGQTVSLFHHCRSRLVHADNIS